MLDKIREVFRHCSSHHVIRYVFFGGLTTLVNLVTYALLRRPLHSHLNIANAISISAAIVFAYFVNSRFVFDSCAGTFAARLRQFTAFVSARLSTMVIEIGGVWLMSDVLHIHDMAAKLLIQFVILVLNYLFSRFLVFRRKTDRAV